MRVLISYMWKVGLPNMHIAEMDKLLQLLLPPQQHSLFVGKGSPFNLLDNNNEAFVSNNPNEH